MMKKIIFSVLFCLMVCVPVSAEEYAQYTDPGISYNTQYAEVSVKFPNGVTTNTVYCNGRLCVALDEGLELMGAEMTQLNFAYRIAVGNSFIFLSTEAKSNRPGIVTYNNESYISLYELITPFGYEMIVDSNCTYATVIKYNSSVLANTTAGGENSAYIRLEDIAADGMKPDGTAKYSVSMLEKLKYTGEYLYLNGQEYYIAWIPVYTCPSLNYTNDVSVYYNLYNSYFLYVLDYMTDHNGHLGLHGYTHQYGNKESGDGYEWGEATPYTEEEQQQRMILAKQSAAKLGYEPEFFEFPHYGATDSQLKMAENYFDVIYQYYPDNSLIYEIVTTARSGKNVFYVPTLAGYVRYKRDDSIYGNIDTCVNNGYVLSMYFHPVIDEDNIFISEYNNVRYWCYENEAALPAILNYIRNYDYNFRSFN